MRQMMPAEGIPMERLKTPLVTAHRGAGRSNPLNTTERDSIIRASIRKLPDDDPERTRQIS